VTADKPDLGALTSAVMKSQKLTMRALRNMRNRFRNRLCYAADICSQHRTGIGR
jgi:hypothetical protein